MYKIIRVNIQPKNKNIIHITDSQQTKILYTAQIVKDSPVGFKNTQEKYHSMQVK